MLISLPIYVEVCKAEGKTQHVCRPAFMQAPSVRDEHLGLALHRLRRRLKQTLDQLASLPRHESIAITLFSPEFQTHLFKHTIELRKRRPKVKFLWIVFRALGRRIAVTPSLPELWLEIPSGQEVEARCLEFLTRYFREQEKLADRSEVAVTPEQVAVDVNAWVTTLDLRLNMRQTSRKKLERELAALFDESKPDGATELQSVGRCLDWLYPDDLQRGVGRQREVAQLVRLLAAVDRRPIAVVGPRLVGKTTVIHEAVRSRLDGLTNPQTQRRNVWLISPQRLVSGMMYVGQWEGRLQAILKEMRRRQHVFYVDDFLGMYHAGISRDAKHSVADVIKPFILRRDVRVLAEFSVEAWRKFQERDRGLADQFHVLRVGATSEVETRGILLEVQRQLETELAVRFDLAVLPTVLRLQSSYIRDAAFPGKAASFLRQLARKRSRQEVTREHVLEEFHQRTGLSARLIDDRSRLNRRLVEMQMRLRVVGQPAATEAATDVVMTAKAQLADPTRPLATLLFLGPTGVGKTQCAKALAEVMFSDAQRLVRFDMNEFVTPYAAAQLAGTIDEPEGLLTSAVRRQPFCVVLLDEIEKAHPDVFDLLLQVLGEGRLTDVLGRTTDFSNAVIVMTSNLGTTAGRSHLGLGAGESREDERYFKAAEQFFRPEFFNRLDRIVPFGSLSRDDMRRIAANLLDEVLRRDGLVRRRCALSIEPQAMERIVDAGYHPQFGARALKRSIEQQLVQPIATTLAALETDVPTLLRVWPSPSGVRATGHSLEATPAAPVRPSVEVEPLRVLEQVMRYLDEVEHDLAQAKSAADQGGRGVSREQIRYFALKEQWRRARDCVVHLRDGLRQPRRGAARPETAPRTPAAKEVRAISRSIPVARLLRDIQSAQDIHAYIAEMAVASGEVVNTPRDWQELWNELAFLHACATPNPVTERVLVIVRPLARDATLFQGLYEQALGQASQELGYEVSAIDGVAFADAPTWMRTVMSGPGIWPLMKLEEGVHVYCRKHENLLPLHVDVVPLGNGELMEEVEQLQARYASWYERQTAGLVGDDEDPLPLGRLIRFYNEDGPTLDLRTGRSLPHLPTPEQWKDLWLAGLPLASNVLAPEPSS